MRQHRNEVMLIPQPQWGSSCASRERERGGKDGHPSEKCVRKASNGMLSISDVLRWCDGSVQSTAGTLFIAHKERQSVRP